MIYADNSATTKLDKQVLLEMLPYLTNEYGNPSSNHSFGKNALKAIDEARVRIANKFKVLPEEIYFTSGGTESDNWALNGLIRNGKYHIISTIIEHKAILNTLFGLKNKGIIGDYTLLKVDNQGQIDIDELRDSILPQTALVSIMTANNEIGTIQNLTEISKVCLEKSIPFHTDSVQYFGKKANYKYPFQLADMVSLSGHKIHGPKGIGLLYVRKGIPLNNFMYGGSQEYNKRPGTQNVASIVGLAKAVEFLNEDNNLSELDAYVQQCFDDIGYSRSPGQRVFMNNQGFNKVNGLFNIRINGTQSNQVLKHFDKQGICISAGSACCSREVKPSYVLKAIGLSDYEANSSVRISLGKYNTKKDCQTICQILEKLSLSKSDNLF